MTDDEVLILFHARALAHAKRFNRSLENAEDIASEMVLRKLEGHGKKQAIRHSAQDARRKLLGDGRNGMSWYLKNPLLLIPEGASKFGEDPTTCLGISEPGDEKATPDETIAEWDLIVKYRDCLSDIHKCVFVLLSVFGFSHKEVALCLGCEDSNVSHLLKSIRRTILENYPPEENE